jgi:transketolase
MRSYAMVAISAANSGHTGGAMSITDIALYLAFSSLIIAFLCLESNILFASLYLK